MMKIMLEYSVYPATLWFCHLYNRTSDQAIQAFQRPQIVTEERFEDATSAMMEAAYSSVIANVVLVRSWTQSG